MWLEISLDPTRDHFVSAREPFFCLHTPLIRAQLASGRREAGRWPESKSKSRRKRRVFGNIVSAIFGSKHAASVTAAASPSAPSPSAGSATAPSSTAAGASAPSAGTSAGSATAKPISKADVEAILAKLADEQDE